MKTSRDARRVLDTLSSLSINPPSPEDTFIAEGLCYSFHAKTICSHIKRMYNPKSKGNPDSMIFYVKPTFSLNKGRRNKDTWEMSHDERRVYWLMGNHFLLEDYSYEQLQTMKTLCGYDYSDVEQAIKIAKSEDVHSIPYVLRVAEGIVARRSHHQDKIQDRRKMFHVEQGESMHDRTRVEIASLMYNWDQTIQNIELDQKVKRLWEDK